MHHVTEADCSFAVVVQADKEALAHIVYNLDGEHGEVDAQMIEMLRPSIEEAEPIETMDMALDYIGKRGAQVRLHRQRINVLTTRSPCNGM